MTDKIENSEELEQDWEEMYDERVHSAHNDYIGRHFGEIHRSHGKVYGEKSLLSEVYSDGTYPIVSFHTSRLGKNIRHYVIPRCHMLVGKDEVTADLDTDEATMSQELQSVSLVNEGYDRDPSCDVFFHRLGFSAECSTRGASVAFNIGHFFEVEYPSRAMSYVVAGEYFNVVYDDSGAHTIMLPANLEFSSDSIRDLYLNLLLPTLSEVAMDLLQRKK